MNVIELVQSQLTEVLRIGLIVGLVITMLRTEAVTGRLIPLALGVLFVAVVLPLTNPKAGVELLDAVLAGIVANTVILAGVLAVALLVQRLRR